MSTQAIIKFGPHGGKIVGFKGTTPIYMHEAEAHGLHHEQFGEGTPFVEAKAAGLQVRVHPTEHDRVSVAWRNADKAKGEAWIAAHPLPPGAKITHTSISTIVDVPKAWAAQPGGAHLAKLAAAAKVKAEMDMGAAKRGDVAAAAAERDPESPES